MSQPFRILPLAALALAVVAAPAMAGTLRCRSVNGNVTCSGDGAVSCQTVNGRTVCVGGGGSAVQSFGGSAAPNQSDGTAADPYAGDMDPDMSDLDDMDDDGSGLLHSARPPHAAGSPHKQSPWQPRS